MVLEARDRVGGRTLNADIGGGHITEIGGQYAGPTQDRILALAQAVGVKTFPTYNSGSNVMISGGDRTLYPAAAASRRPGGPRRHHRAPPARQARQGGRRGRALEDEARRRPRPQTFDDWLRAEIPSEKGRAIFSTAARATWGADPSELSLLYAATYVAGGGNAARPGSILRLLTTAGGAQERRFVGGSQVVSEKLADRLDRASCSRAPVRRVAHEAAACAWWPRGHRPRSPRDPRPAARAGGAARLLARAARGQGAVLQARAPGSLTKATRSTTAPSGATRASAVRPPPISGRPTRPSTTRRPTAARGAVRLRRRLVACEMGPAAADERRAQVLANFATYYGDAAAARPLLRAGLDEGALDEGLPGRARRPGRADEVRGLAAARRRQRALRRQRDVRLLAGLYGRRGARGRAGRPGGPRGAAGLTPGVYLLRDSFPERPALDIAVSHALLLRVARGEAQPAVRLYRPAPTLAFGRLDALRPGFAEAGEAARDAGFEPIVRLAGGHAAAYHEQSLIYEEIVAQGDVTAGLHDRFRDGADLLAGALAGLGVETQVGEIPGEYCPGAYTVSAAGRLKLVGSAQRAVRGAALLSAFILVGDGDRLRGALFDVIARWRSPGARRPPAPWRTSRPASRCPSSKRRCWPRAARTSS